MLESVSWLSINALFSYHAVDLVEQGEYEGVQVEEVKNHYSERRDKFKKCVKRKWQ